MSDVERVRLRAVPLTIEDQIKRFSDVLSPLFNSTTDTVQITADTSGLPVENVDVINCNTDAAHALHDLLTKNPLGAGYAYYILWKAKKVEVIDQTLRLFSPDNGLFQHVEQVFADMKHIHRELDRTQMSQEADGYVSDVILRLVHRFHELYPSNLNYKPDTILAMWIAEKYRAQSTFSLEDALAFVLKNRESDDVEASDLINPQVQKFIARTNHLQQLYNRLFRRKLD